MSYEFARDEVRYSDFDDAELTINGHSTDAEDGLLAGGRRHSRPAKRLFLVEPRLARNSWAQRADDTDVGVVLTALIDQMRLKYLQLSNIERLIFSEEYMAVIGLGPRVVPALIADMRSGVIPWYWALKAITREDVGGNVAAGDFRSLRQAWLDWGRKHGLV